MAGFRMHLASTPKERPPQPTRFATLEPLEPRRLLSAAYSLTDLGTSSAIPGVISLNNNGQVLTVSVDSNNKVVYGINSGGNSTPLPANLKNPDPLVIDNLGRTVAAGSGASGAGEQVSPVFQMPSLGVARK